MINLKESQYFQSLPTLVQESIMQSGLDFTTEEELHQYAEQCKNEY